MMKDTKLNICLFLLIGMMIFSCKPNEVEGIKIGDTLNTHLDFQTNRKLRMLISKTLEKDEQALTKLNQFWCGGGAGCYDLGFIITQIIYKLGENEFVWMLNQLKDVDKKNLKSLVMAGLEYGDNDKDGRMDRKTIETEFPNILKILNKN